MKHTFFTLLTATALALPAAGAMADPIIGKGPGHEWTRDSSGRVVYRDMNRPGEVYTSPQVHYIDRKEVQAIQQALDESGFYTAGVDGVWGPKTTKALKDFQVSSGLEPTGTMDMQTLDQLGLQLSAADQIDTQNDPIQWRDGDTNNRASTSEYIVNEEDRIDGSYVRGYTHQNDR